jgi:transposase
MLGLSAARRTAPQLDRPLQPAGAGPHPDRRYRRATQRSLLRGAGRPRWTPASPAQQHLRALLTARETLVQERLRLRNRRHAAGYPASQTLGTELQAPVLATIPGLGLTTAGALLAGLPLDRPETACHVAAYVGFRPHVRTSGSSVRGRGHSGPSHPHRCARRCSCQPACHVLQPGRARVRRAPGCQR